ncbi:MAG: ABC transporter ATP-binding protein [Spirochaetales bacterium]|nr:ABC transporter ATP-binding protein [Spirochaetales bacterium]
MIQTRNLIKHYGNLRAVNGISLNINQGEIYGFLGPNGAGKTSTIKMLLGITRPTSGEIYLFGERFTPEKVDVRKRIGVVPEKHPQGIWTWMTAGEYLAYFANIFEVEDADKRIDYLLEKVHLIRVKNKPFKTFSRGMLQKLNIIRALLHNPDILILDEPISGLDPIGVKQIRDLIVAETRENRSIFVSSHLLSEVEKICHRIAIINRGSLVAEDSMDRLLSKLVRNKEVYIDVEEVPPGLIEEIKKMPFVRDCRLNDLTITIEVPREGDYRRDLALFIFNRGLIPLRIQEKAPTLEEAFITITGENIEKLAGKRGNGE